MENLIKQLRVRFSGQEDQDDSYNMADGRIRPRKTVSFKGERKKTKNWFERQFSGQMSNLDDSNNDEFATAVAAAALAIALLEAEGNLDQKRTDEELKRILTKTKSKLEGSSEKPFERKLSRWFSGKEAKEDGRTTGESSMRKSTTLDQRLPVDSTTDINMPTKAMGAASSIKKTPTLADKYPNGIGSKKFEQVQPPVTGLNSSSTIKSRASSSGSRMQDGNEMSSSKVETEVDAWKKAKLAKIKRRYEKLMSTILEWENEKKTKAKRRMERKEKEIEEKRARVLQEYRNDISRIDKIAGGARAVADEKRRNDEAKTIEKARASSARGTAPKECSCF